MPLDPQAQIFLDQISALGGPALHELPVDQARQVMQDLQGTKGEPEPVASVSNRRIPGPGGAIPIRIYSSQTRGQLPVLLFFHGGGWVGGNLDTHDAPCRALANAAECVVVSVDYRLAPEHKFPAAADDCYATLQWVFANAATFNGDASRLALGGDSAGGNLTAVVSQMSRDQGGPPVVFQLLIYPVTDYRFDTRSYQQNADGYLLTKDLMIWFWNHYLRQPSDGDLPQASPLRAPDLRGLPPALIITAEFDPLRDEGEAYGLRLQQAGVPAIVKRYDGMIHAFVNLGGVFDQGRQAINEAAASLRAAFESGVSAQQA